MYLSVYNPDTGGRSLIKALHILSHCPDPGSEGKDCIGCRSNVPKEGLQVTIGGAAVSVEANTEMGRVLPGY